MLWQHPPAQHPLHVMSSCSEVSASPEPVNKKLTLELHLSCFPQSLKIFQKTGLKLILCHVPAFIFGLQAQKLMVFNPSVVCCCLTRKCVISKWIIIHLACEKLHQMWRVTQAQSEIAQPAVTPISCCRNIQQRKQEPPQWCCDAWKRCLMFRRLKKNPFRFKV